MPVRPPLPLAEAIKAIIQIHRQERAAVGRFVEIPGDVARFLPEGSVEWDGDRRRWRLSEAGRLLASLAQWSAVAHPQADPSPWEAKAAELIRDPTDPLRRGEVASYRQELALYLELDHLGDRVVYLLQMLARLDPRLPSQSSSGQQLDEAKRLFAALARGAITLSGGR